MKLNYRVVHPDGTVTSAGDAVPGLSAMQRNTEQVGQGSPLVILHGLFGSGDNWQTVAKHLDGGSPVILPDLPNHGQSPHTQSFLLEETAPVVFDFLDGLGCDGVRLAGHSLGGKIAMLMALQHPGFVDRLCIVDIAPRRYPPRHEAIIEAMREVENAGVNSRSEADAIMADLVPDSRVRAFLLKSLVSENGNGYRWRVNLDLIDRDYDHIVGWPDSPEIYEGDTLFIAGGLSNYVGSSDLEKIRESFPAARFVEVPGAGHWLHAEKPREFLDAFAPFIGGG